MKKGNVFCRRNGFIPLTNRSDMPQLVFFAAELGVLNATNCFTDIIIQ